MNGLRERYPNIPILLAAIHQSPGMFLGQPTISGLDLFFAGIEFAENLHEVPKESRFGGFDWEGFEKWVKSKHNPQCLSLRSFSLAARLAGSESEGFSLWFRWYEEYNSADSK